MMRVTPTELPDVKLLTSTRHPDARGYLYEAFNAAALPLDCEIRRHQWVQDNVSFSHAGVVRGLHYQLMPGQAKIIRVLRGKIFDVAVDLRCESPTFAQWVGIELSAESQNAVYIPVGFGHGFAALEESLVLYKCSAAYDPALERGIVYHCPKLNITWPIDTPIVSDKDAALKSLNDVTAADLPAGVKS